MANNMDPAFPSSPYPAPLEDECGLPAQQPPKADRPHKSDFPAIVSCICAASRQRRFSPPPFARWAETLVRHERPRILQIVWRSFSVAKGERPRKEAALQGSPGVGRMQTTELQADEEPKKDQQMAAVTSTTAGRTSPTRYPASRPSTTTHLYPVSGTDKTIVRLQMLMYNSGIAFSLRSQSNREILRDQSRNMAGFRLRPGGWLCA